MLHRLSIKLSTPLLVGLPTLAVGGALSFVWLAHSRAAVHELAESAVSGVHEQVERHVSSVLSMPMRVCRMNAAAVQRGDLDPSNLAAWAPALIAQARAFDMLSAVTWGGADGTCTWIARYADGAYYLALKSDPRDPVMREWRVDDGSLLTGAPSSTFEFDLFDRPWYRSPVDEGEATWCPPYAWLGGEDSDGATLGISYGIPMTDESGELIGVIDADLSLQDLSKYLGTVRIARSGLAYLTDPEGQLIAVSNDAQVVTPVGERIEAMASADPTISGSARRIDAGERLTEPHDIAGEPSLVRVSQIGEDVGLEWTLVTVVPERDFTQRIEAGFRRSAATSGLAVVAAIALGFGAATLLVNPLMALVTAVRRIGDGDLSTPVEISHAPEYERVADELNEMTAGLRDRMRMRRSLALAMEVQKNLLPSDAPTIPGLDIDGHSTYCDETGGDYYDYLDVSGVDDDTAAIALGDVSGHGVAAAMLMATARGILRSRCDTPGSLSDLLEHLNTLLVQDTGGTKFMTMLLLTIAPTRNEMRWASAGHGPPIVYDAESGEFLPIDGGSVPLGLVRGFDFEEYVETNVRSGQIILAATDGLWEMPGEQGGMFGMERMKDIIRTNAHRSAAEIGQVFRDELTAWRGALSQEDDLTFVVVKVL